MTDQSEIEAVARASWMRRHVYEGYNAETKEHMWLMAKSRYLEEVRELVAGVDAHRAAREPGWRPIETAPRDGTYVDLWVAHDDQLQAGFRIPDVCWQENEGHADWWYEDGDCACRPYPHGRKPTHWRLPPPEPEA